MDFAVLFFFKNWYDRKKCNEMLEALLEQTCRQQEQNEGQ